MALTWDFAEIVNITISTMIGLALSFLTAFFYERRVNNRRAQILRDLYGDFESYRDFFDWQHWDIVDGKLAPKPIQTYMRIKYREDRVLDFQWLEGDPTNTSNVKGYGMLVFDDAIKGKMFFAESNKINFGTRDFLTYELLYHDGLYHMAILVNADDEGTKYAMMRPRAWQP
jgi:hypothetical protein